MFFTLDCAEFRFFKAFGFETLPAESCLNRHNHKHIDLAQIRLYHVKIYVRIDNIFCSDHWKPFAAMVENAVDYSDHYAITAYLKPQVQR